jgi:hypothetical protein
MAACDRLQLTLEYFSVGGGGGVGGGAEKEREIQIDDNRILADIRMSPKHRSEAAIRAYQRNVFRR